MPPIFLSEIQKKPVWDTQGERVGRCVDVLVRDVGQPFPHVCALALRDGADAPRFVMAEQVGWLRPSILLTTDRARLSPYEPQGNELWLARQVLDRQIVDVDGRRVVRVNDLQLARVGDHLCLVGADVGTMGLLRRLGVEHPVRTLFSALRRSRPKPSSPGRTWHHSRPTSPSACACPGSASANSTRPTSPPLSVTWTGVPVGR